jgi:serine acetyltransferase
LNDVFNTIGNPVSDSKFLIIWLGIGTNILHNVNIGNNCIIGGGSLVCNDTKDNSVYYGSPCKFIREHKFGDKYLT